MSHYNKIDKNFMQNQPLLREMHKEPTFGNSSSLNTEYMNDHIFELQRKILINTTDHVYYSKLKSLMTRIFPRLRLHDGATKIT